MGRLYKGFGVAIVTAADEEFSHLLFDLCHSLGAWARNLCVIDIGLSAATRGALAAMNVTVIAPPEDMFAGARLRSNYIKALYLRPSLPELVSTDLIMWIDSDCWVQREEAIPAYLDSAIAFPEKFTLCAILDVEYPRCIDDYLPYQERYREQYAALFGAPEAERLFGKAILSAGVFAARRTCPAWAAWRTTVSQVYRSDAAFERFDLAHMGEQLSLNVVLHRDHAYRLLNAEMNWHCHCSDVAREGGQVRIRPSGRIPAIVHLADLKNPPVVARYRRDRLFYERPGGRTGPDVRPQSCHAELVANPIAPPRTCVFTVLMGNVEALNEQPVAANSRLPFICFTDDPNLRSDSWDVRLVPRLFGADVVRSQRAVKIRPFDYLPEFDASLYIDNSVVLTKTPESFIEKNFPRSGFCLIQHSYRATVYDEFQEVAAQDLDKQNRIAEQFHHYLDDYPHILQEKPYWTAILLRDHRSPALRKMAETWLAHVHRYSRRDQLSVNLAFRLAGLTPDALRFDNFKSEYHVWPRKMRRQLDGLLPQPFDEAIFVPARIRALEVEKARLLGEKAELLKSTSWRVTAPLRGLARLFRAPFREET